MQPIVETAKKQLSQAQSFLDFAKVFATLFKISVPGQDPPKDPNDYKNENSDYGLQTKGKKAREKLNARAREIIARVERPEDLTPEERDILKQYSGKGGLSENSQYEYYTPQHVAEGGWDALTANSLTSGNILDPSCFVPTTLVKTREGRKPISEILNGDQVFCHDGGYHEVINLVSHDVETSLVAIEVSAFPSPLESTSDHELYAVQTKKCTARKGRPCHVQKGETCQYLQKYGSKTREHRCGEPWKSYEPAWVPAENLQVGDCLVEVFDRRVEDVSTLVLSADRTANLRGPLAVDCDVTILKAIGIYLAEGFVDENSVVFAFREDETDMHEALIAAFEPHGWKVHVTEREANESSRFRIHSRSLVGLMKQFGCGAENKAIPAWCMTLPLEKQAALLWGIWRGDGSTSRDGITAVASVSRELAFGIRDILYRFGIVPSVGIRAAIKPETKLISGRTITRQLPMYSVDIYGEHLSNAAQVFGIQHPQIEARSHTRNLSGVVRDGMVFHKIKQASRFDYAGKVHDLTVEGAHSYTAGPCTVHNCGHGMFSATKPAGMVITGCDLDPVASKVAALLNPGDAITNKSFEKFCSETPRQLLRRLLHQRPVRRREGRVQV